jgi:hypothetical protein
MATFLNGNGIRTDYHYIKGKGGAHGGHPAIRYVNDTLSSTSLNMIRS